MNTKTKILIVDDDPRNIRIMEEILDGFYTFDVAYDGLEALEKIELFQPDIILLDNMMPEIDGLEVCRRVRSQHQNMDIKIIMVSGRASKAEQQEGFLAGANHYLTKPFEDEMLISTINKVLDTDPNTSAQIN